MKHRTPKINPTKSKNINVEYRDKTDKNIDPKKTTHNYTQKKTQNNTQTFTNPDRYRPHRQHTKKGHCVKNNTVLCENQKHFILLEHFKTAIFNDGWSTLWWSIELYLYFLSTEGEVS